MLVRLFAVAIALVVMWPGARLDAAPILEDPFEISTAPASASTFHADVLGIYDSSLDRLRITSQRENAEYRGPATSLLFTSFFELTSRCRRIRPSHRRRHDALGG